MPKPVTMQDIANQLGISKVAVSKALRGQHDISRDTTEKVLSLAKQMGYRPNLLAKKLSAKKTQTIGLLVPKIAHHFLSQAIDSIYLSANDLDYEIVMMVSEENKDLERKHIETLLSMRVDGLLVSISEQTVDADIFHKVKENGTPLVFFDRVLKGQGFPCIRSADEEGAEALINFAVQKGYHQFGHIGGYQHVSIGKQRYQGFIKALRSHGLTPREEHIVFGGFSRKDGYEGLGILLERAALPQIIFAVTYPVALGTMMRADEAGLNIPADLDLVCFGSSNYNQFIKPSITGIKQPAKEIGKLALEQLIKMIDNPDLESFEDIVIPVEINTADTCISITGKTLR